MTAIDPITGVSNAVTMLLSVVGKAMDFIPDYDQRKKQKFYDLRKAYENEKSKTSEYRDDNLVGIYRDDLMRFVSVFDFEINKTPVPIGDGAKSWAK